MNYIQMYETQITSWHVSWWFKISIKISKDIIYLIHCRVLCVKYIFKCREKFIDMNRPLKMSKMKWYFVLNSKNLSFIEFIIFTFKLIGLWKMYNAGKESNIQDHGEGLSLRQTVRQAFIYGLWKLTFQHTFYLLVVVTFDYVKLMLYQCIVQT